MCIVVFLVVHAHGPHVALDVFYHDIILWFFVSIVVLYKHVSAIRFMFMMFYIFSLQVVSFYHEHVLIKDPGTNKKTPWHVDQTYYPINGDKVSQGDMLLVLQCIR